MTDKKVVVLVVSDKYYILNFYECVLQLFFPRMHTLIYCDPFDPLPAGILKKIRSSPTRLVVLIPGPEVILSKLNVDEKKRDAAANNVLWLKKHVTSCVFMKNYVYDFKLDEDLKYERVCNDLLSNFHELKLALQRIHSS